MPLANGPAGTGAAERSGEGTGGLSEADGCRGRVRMKEEEGVGLLVTGPGCRSPAVALEAAVVAADGGAGPAKSSSPSLPSRVSRLRLFASGDRSLDTVAALLPVPDLPPPLNMALILPASLATGDLPALTCSTAASNTASPGVMDLTPESGGGRGNAEAASAGSAAEPVRDSDGPRRLPFILTAASPSAIC